ncbi:hypothetical protein [Vibrio algarum]|uniref:Uncharacterized protein n=1 Tax=Vibrio algarum TaxID=3020714 RepID=A0ABT4YXK1_9VIBR|nr:hypothetical protein [Vibrio sp. KJ40-1]MDB1126282.1 hypothetical protein [Vibrio sp. KJ40-1]MDB1126286.1 hypothetical protein [Vibrio sp. KJ40-1]
MIKVYIDRVNEESIHLAFPSLGEYYTCKGEFDVIPAIKDFIGEDVAYELIEGYP